MLTNHINTPLSYLSRMFCITFAFSSVSIASPIVTGTTISWPAGDWHEVQRADNYLSICNGGLTCDVADGRYIVINHRTGERFEITVASDAAPTSAIVVEGQTISWPDNGWYQVQRTDTYESVCNGGRKCTVEPGRYFVINHSTGDRNEVSVQGSDNTGGPVPTESVIDVSSDNVISWPDNGWYEVQSASTYASICAGVRTCTVEAGTYNVINHTTGERFDGIEVGGITSVVNTGLTVELPKANFMMPDGRWGSGRWSPWDHYAQWQTTAGDWLYIDSQVQGPIGRPSSPRGTTTTSGGAQWAANYSDTHLQIVIIGPEGNAYPSASIFLDSNNSKGAQYDGVDDYHIIIPVNNLSGNRWENNTSTDDEGYLYYADQSATLDPSAIQFATCTCAGHKTLWEINIDLSAANIPVNRAFGFDVRLNWSGQDEYAFGWADGSNTTQATPANMGTMVLVSE